MKIGMLLCALLLLSTFPLAGQDGRLSFDPAAPLPRESIALRYDPLPTLAAERTLVVRGRLRMPGDEAYDRSPVVRRVATLTRGPDGIFRGTLELPDSVVYGVFAVEDADARIVDGNRRAGFELLVHGPDGQPLFHALRQRAEELLGRNGAEALATTRRLVELYPHSPDAAGLLLFHQTGVMGEAGRGAVEQEHRERLTELHERFSPREAVSGDDAGTMMWYARSLDREDLVSYWRSRLLAEHPTHTLAVRERVYELSSELRADHSARLAEFDRLWETAGPVDYALARAGFGAAERSRDVDGVLRWAERYGELFPASDGYVARIFLRFPGLRDQGLARIADAIRNMRAGDGRDLFTTSDEHASAIREPVAHLLAAQARTHREAEDSALAVEAFDEAAELAWMPYVFREGAEMHAARGDTAEAAAFIARIVIDPDVPISYADSARAIIGDTARVAEWSGHLRDARAAMDRLTFADATDEALPDDIVMLDSAGTAVDFHELLDGETSVVVFWSRFCVPSVEALPEIQVLAARLAEHGVRLWAVTDEPPSDALASFLRERDVTLPVLHDVHRAAGNAFEQWGTPSFFVVDARAHVRFDHTWIDSVMRQVLVLRGLV